MISTHGTLEDFNAIWDQKFSSHVLVIDGWGISRETTLRWMLLDLTDDKSGLVQAMASSTAVRQQVKPVMA